MRRSPAAAGFALAVLIAGFALPARADKAVEPGIPTIGPTWTARFEQAVHWQRVAPLGHLVVATGCCLNGLDPSSGKVVWSRDGLGEVDESSFESIPGTALVMVATRGPGARTLVLDSADGRIVFDSVAAGISNILHRTMLFESGGLLILGQKTDDPTIRLFLADVATGEIRWSNDRILGDMSAGMKKLAGLLAGLAQASAGGELPGPGRPLEVGADAFVMPSGSALLEVSTATGEILWRVENADGPGTASAYRVPGRPGMILVGTEVTGQGMSRGGAEPVTTKYCAYRLKDGSRAWPGSVKLNGPLNPPVLLDDGVLISPGGSVKGKLKLVKYDTGESVWGKKGKGIDSDGGIVDYHRIGNALVVTTGYDSAWTRRGTEYYLNVVDLDAGAFRFPKSLKVRGRMLDTELLPKGVLYVTTHEVDIFDPATGASRLERSVSSEDLVTADAGNLLYAFSSDDGALFRVDKAAATVTRLGEDRVRLEGKDVPRSLEVRGDGVTLLGMQNVVGFDREGAVRFRTYYPAPRHPAWLRALMIAQSVRAGMAAAEAGLAGAAFAQYASTRDDGTLEREVTEELAQGYARVSEGAAGISADYARMAKQRFRASAEATDFWFMMVQLDRGFGIAQVGKDDGAIRALIPIGKDEAPSYDVDDVAHRVYYRPSDKQVVGYAF